MEDQLGRWERGSAPLSKDAISVFSAYMQTIFFYFEGFLKELSHDQYSSRTKGSIYLVKHIIYIQPFSMEVDWMFNGSIYYVLYLQICVFRYGRCSDWKDYLVKYMSN